jgi:DDHD domain
LINITKFLKYCSIRRDELERCWWEEEAAVLAGPKGNKKVSAPTASTTATASISSQPQQQPEAEHTAPDGSPSWLDFMVPNKGEEIGVLVRSGSYEVDLPRRQLKPCYWPSTRHRVLRGTWYAEKSPGEWVPLREFLADQLEQAYISQIWAPKKGLLNITAALASPEKTAPAVHAARLDLNTIVDIGLYALFVSENEAYLMRDSSFTWLKHLPGASSAAAPTKFKLRRGYVAPTIPILLQKEADLATEAIDNSIGANIVPTELVLVVHGIGQTLQRANIAADALALRAGLRQLDKEYLLSTSEEGSGRGGGVVGKGDEVSHPSSPQKKKLAAAAVGDMAAAAAAATATAPPSALPAAPYTSRVEVLPVQWRKTLSLEVDKLAESLRPPGIPSLRQVLHSTAVEVLLYLTPLHRAAVLGSLVASLNSAYSRFMLRNPQFKGSVSVVAHSLGSVLCWDILCNQPVSGMSSHHGVHMNASSGLSSFSNNLSSAAQGTGATAGAAAAAPAAPEWSAAPVEISQLSFQVDQLILAGSPLGCFLALRGIDQSKNRGLGTADSAKFMQCHPDYDVVPDGLPAVRRFYNIYHPYDPVAYRLEPLAYSLSELARHRGALVELYGGGGGKRLHIAAQELGDNMSSAASRLGSTLAGALTFGRGQKRGAASATAGAGAGLAVVADIKEHGARQGDAAVAAIDAAFAGAAAEVATTTTTEEAAAEATAAPMDLEFGHPEFIPSNIPTTTTTTAATSISRVAGGELPITGGWPTAAAGRIDFALQEASLENQYVAALKAHFIYWGSMDVALFIYRAVKGLDVLNGKPLTVVKNEKEKSAGGVVAAAAVETAAGVVAPPAAVDVVELKKEESTPADIVFGEADDQLNPALV